MMESWPSIYVLVSCNIKRFLWLITVTILGGKITFRTFDPACSTANLQDQKSKFIKLEVLLTGQAAIGVKRIVISQSLEERPI